MKPWHQVDGYTFQWPELSDQVARDFMVRVSAHLMEKTPAERVEYLDKIIPIMRHPTGSVSAFDQHLVITALTTWREDNRERISA